MGGSLAYPEVRVFAEQYLACTVNTSGMVALVLNTSDLKARVECVKDLYSEYGNGDASKAHLVLPEGFLGDLLTGIEGFPVSAARWRCPQRRRSARGSALFESADQRVVQGALPAQEHLAYSMLTRLHEDVREYKDVYETDDDFHEACEYFYVRIGEAEKYHKAQDVTSAAAVCRDEGDLVVVIEDFTGFVTLTAEYWRGDVSEMTRQAASA
ncbi:hypothetical protein [Streptomyces hydrogenans]|uniref:hypothetical protein n=1 Tax=Streptomyces hydrogenans TaxID=1873719 RepID=UPI0037F155B8